MIQTSYSVTTLPLYQRRLPLFDFVAGTLPTGATFARASEGTRFNAAGLLVSEAANVARFDHDPATPFAPGGLLIEPERTNMIRNSTMVGAVAGTPGGTPFSGWAIAFAQNGMTRQIVGTGVENGVSYLDVRFYGTMTATFTANNWIDFSTTATAAAGEVWAASAYLKLVSGTAPAAIRLGIVEYNSAAGSGVQTITPMEVTGALNRFVTTRTVTASVTNNVRHLIQIAFENATTYDFTLRIGLPQLEKAAAASTPIPTTNATATRAAETLTLAFAVPDGARMVRYTFDDGSTQDVPVTIASGTTTVAGGTLNRTRIRKVALLPA